MSSFLATFKEEGLVSSALTASGNSVCGKKTRVSVPSLQLSTPEIELPDGTKVSSRTRNILSNANDEEEYYHNHVATSGFIFTRDSTASKAIIFPRSIAYRLLESAKVLELSCTDLVSTQENSVKNGVTLQKIRIRLSDTVLPHCITLSETDNDELVVDAISQGGIIFNFAFKFSNFLSKSDANSMQQTPTLTDVDFLRWGNIQNPFGFSVIKHKNPYQMYAVSCNTLVVAFQDGSLIKLSRNSTLGALTASDFESSSYNVSLSSLLSWKRTFSNRKTSTAFPELSTDAIFSLVHIPGTNYLITLSINLTLKLWSLDTLASLWERIIPNSDANNSQGLLTTEPLPLLRLSKQFSKASKLGHYYLSTFLPINNGSFKLWQIDSTANHPASIITDLGQSMEMISSPPDKFSVWLISNYFILESDQYLEFWVLWKSDISSLVQYAKVERNINSLSNLQWQTTLSNEVDQPEDLNLLRSPLSSSSSNQLEFYAKRVFRVGRFSEQILETALCIFQKHAGVPIEKSKKKKLLSNVSLQNEISKVVNSSVATNTIAQIDNSVYNDDSKDNEIVLQWVRFERLCMELRKLSNEVLSMSVDIEAGLATIIKGASISILRPLSDLEIIFYNRSASFSNSSLMALEHNSTTDITKSHRTAQFLYYLDNYFRTLSRQVTFELAKRLYDDCTQEQHLSLNDRGLSILETAFGSQFSEGAANRLAQSLGELGNLDELLELIYDQLISVPEVETNGAFNINGASFLNQSLYSNTTVSYKIILQVIVLLLLANDNPSAFASQDYIQYLAKYLNLFKSFTLIIESLHTSISVNNNSKHQGDEIVEPQSSSVQTVSFIENLIVESLVSPTFSRNNVKDILQSLVCSINSSVLPTAVTELVSNLALSDIDQAVKFSQYLTSSPFDTFIKGFVQLYAGGEDENNIHDQVSYYFKKAAIGFVEEMSRENDTIKARVLMKITPVECKPSLKQLLEVITSSFGENPVSAPHEYFIYLSELFQHKGYFSRAFEYCKLAANRIAGKEEDSPKAIKIYKQLYELALKNGDYDQAYNSAVVELASDTVQSQTAIENLIIDMCENGFSNKLIKYQFMGQHHLVDQILLKLAQQTSGVNGELEHSRSQHGSSGNTGDKKQLYFQILYSWRLGHGDFRGAATALYLQISYLRSLSLSTTLSSLSSASLTIKLPSAHTSNFELSNNVRITEIYLLLINVLKCMPVDEAWILVQQVTDKNKENIISGNTLDPKRQKSHRDNTNYGYRTKRVVLSFDAIQSEYNSWLDKIEQALNVKVKSLAQKAEYSVHMQSLID